MHIQTSFIAKQTPAGFCLVYFPITARLHEPAHYTAIYKTNT